MTLYQSHSPIGNIVCDWCDPLVIDEERLKHGKPTIYNKNLS